MIVILFFWVTLAELSHRVPPSQYRSSDFWFVLFLKIKEIVIKEIVWLFIYWHVECFLQEYRHIHGQNILGLDLWTNWKGLSKETNSNGWGVKFSISSNHKIRGKKFGNCCILLDVLWLSSLERVELPIFLISSFLHSHSYIFLVTKPSEIIHHLPLYDNVML